MIINDKEKISMKSIRLVFLALFMGLFSMNAFAFLEKLSPKGNFENEPDGFRGLAWGTKESDLPKGEFAHSGRTPEGWYIYRRTPDKMSIGDVKLSLVRYVFAGGVFRMAYMDFASSTRDVAFEPRRVAYMELVKNFGKPNIAHNPTSAYALWEGKKTRIEMGDPKNRGAFVNLPFGKKTEETSSSRTHGTLRFMSMEYNIDDIKPSSKDF